MANNDFFRRLNHLLEDYKILIELTSDYSLLLQRTDADEQLDREMDMINHAIGRLNDLDLPRQIRVLLEKLIKIFDFNSSINTTTFLPPGVIITVGSEILEVPGLEESQEEQPNRNEILQELIDRLKDILD